MPKIFSQYPTYFLVGSGVTLFTISLRSFIGFLIKDDTNTKYIYSIVLSYIVGIFLSFLGNKNLTFKKKANLKFAKIFNFVGIHFVGMLLSLIISTMLRENILDTWLQVELSKFFAFAISAIIVSITTYILNKYIVFK
ncbi:GtrA family protein [Nostoc sp. CHAB 5844]|nr:GtrA family protein [Nostoc sp. CHAB 5844]